MSTLIMVRHGQASFLDDDYDRLSALGKQQAKKLGHFWAANNVTLDAVFVGPRKRHCGTAKIVSQALRDAGAVPPPLTTLEEFDEHHVDELLTHHRQTIAKASPKIAALVEAFEACHDGAERPRRFQRLFEAVAALWVAGRFDKIESWTEFQSSANRAIDRIIASADRGQTMVVFTSVGPITVALQRALQCPDVAALETGWRVFNCSLSEFVFSGPRFTLDRFNSLPHLDPSDWTYR